MYVCIFMYVFMYVCNRLTKGLVISDWGCTKHVLKVQSPVPPNSTSPLYLKRHSKVQFLMSEDIEYKKILRKNIMVKM